jgi:3-methylfumaryl-CoA hydratase
LLSVDLPALAGREGLPLGWHWLYLLDHAHQEDLGRDGHPVRGVFPTPPEPGMRRMWAGGALTRHAPVRLGEPATRRSRVVESRTKEGRSGRLVFLEVEHELWQGEHLCIVERQDIVYRQPPTIVERPAPGTPRAYDDAPLTDGDWAIPVSSTLLFRFSALTYNAHRIHYDRDYARDVEGYPGLVTHGPLQALAMLESVRAAPAVDSAAPATFDYRLTAPLFDHQGLIVRNDADGEGVRSTQASDRSGRRTAQGSYRLL